MKNPHHDEQIGLQQVVNSESLETLHRPGAQTHQLRIGRASWRSNIRPFNEKGQAHHDAGAEPVRDLGKSLLGRVLDLLQNVVLGGFLDE